MGKTTTCYNLLQKKLRNYIIIDGDAFRRHMANKDLTFSREDIIKNNARVLDMVEELMQKGWDVLVAMITPYAEMRKIIKDRFGDNVFMVVLNAPESARAGRINFVKSSIVFEQGNADKVYDTSQYSEDWIRDDILKELNERNLYF